MRAIPATRLRIANYVLADELFPIVLSSFEQTLNIRMSKLCGMLTQRAIYIYIY